jgi:hypothetical protein
VRRTFAAGVVSVGLVSGCSDSSSVETNAGEAEEAQTLARVLPATVWTGDELIVVGGVTDEGHRADGYVVSSDGEPTGSIPALSGPLLAAPVGAKLGNGAVVVVGIPCDEIVDEECQPGSVGAEVYDIDARRWEDLELPADVPEEQQRYTVVGTIEHGAIFSFSRDGRNLWKVTEDRTWSRLPAPPSNTVDACMIGSTIYALSVTDNAARAEGQAAGHPETYFGSDEPIEDVPGTTEPRVLALDTDSADDWTSSEPWTDEITYSAAPLIDCMRESIFVSTATMFESSLTYNVLSGEWQIVPPRPDVTLGVPRVWTGKELLFLPSDSGTPGIAYDPEANTWRTTARGSATMQDGVWSGDAVLGVAPSGEEKDGGPFVYRP